MHAIPARRPRWAARRSANASQTSTTIAAARVPCLVFRIQWLYSANYGRRDVDQLGLNTAMAPNHSIERTPSSKLRLLPVAAHVKR